MKYLFLKNGEVHGNKIADYGGVGKIQVIVILSVSEGSPYYNKERSFAGAQDDKGEELKKFGPVSVWGR